MTSVSPVEVTAKKDFRQTKSLLTKLCIVVTRFLCLKWLGGWVKTSYKSFNHKLIHGLWKIGAGVLKKC